MEVVRGSVVQNRGRSGSTLRNTPLAVSRWALQQLSDLTFSLALLFPSCVTWGQLLNLPETNIYGM